MQKMQYNVPDHMYVFQKKFGVTPPDPVLVLEPRIGSLPCKILAARLAESVQGADRQQRGWLRRKVNNVFLSISHVAPSKILLIFLNNFNYIIISEIVV